MAAALLSSHTEKRYPASPTLSCPQAAQALELVTAALLDVVAPSNCLSLFNVAAACGCVPLRRKARRLALRGFTAAWQQDASGLLTMPERELLGLLCSDSLQVRMQALAGSRGCAYGWLVAMPCQHAAAHAARPAVCLGLLARPKQELSIAHCSCAGGQRSGGVPSPGCLD